MTDFQITVFHVERDESGHPTDDQIEAATMSVEAEDVDEALEIAWDCTNHIDRDWAEGARNSSVKQFLPHPKPEGKHGHRSSMVGDRFCVKFRAGPFVMRSAYKVAGCGFELIPGAGS